jgi:5'-nucleotidase
MPTILITNDDGIDSPILPPLAGALQRVGNVRTVVPDRERSWIGKAISRFDRLTVRPVELEGRSCAAVSGTPADCVNLALFELFPDRPDIVVSGINLGLNFGTAFVLSSGTVGAAIEAWIAGVPAIAFSMALPQDAYGLSGEERTARLGDLPLRAAVVAGEITERIIRHGFPTGVDLFSVNMPANVEPGTPRRVTPIARTAYASLFAGDEDTGYRHSIRRYELSAPAPGSDVEVVRAGEVSIAPMRLDLSAPLPAGLTAVLEGSDRA